MARPQFGGLPPRYLFALNHRSDYRAAKRLNCDRLTLTRKFVLFIHVTPAHFLAMGKTCRFCPKCELWENFVFVERLKRQAYYLVVGMLAISPTPFAPYGPSAASSSTMNGVILGVCLRDFTALPPRPGL